METQNIPKIVPQYRGILMPAQGTESVAMDRVHSMPSCAFVSLAISSVSLGDPQVGQAHVVFPQSGLRGPGTVRIWLSGYGRGRCDSYQHSDSSFKYGSRKLPPKAIVICTCPQGKTPIAYVPVGGVATSTPLSSSLSCPLSWLQPHLHALGEL